MIRRAIVFVTSRREISRPGLARHFVSNFEWSNHPFRDGEAENKRVLTQFEDEFNNVINNSKEKFENEQNMWKGLDLAVAFIKNYELDKADNLYQELLPHARARGLPFIAKALQDVATLRFKQNRQAESAELLEELRDMLPPNPITLHNLGTTYNSLRRHEEALACFEEATRLKEQSGSYSLDYSDYWDLGLVYKNLGRLDEALEYMEKALAGCSQDDSVMLAKVHDSLGSVFFARKNYECAQQHYSRGLDLFRGALGDLSPLTGIAAEMLGKAYMQDVSDKAQLEQAKAPLKLALEVQSIKDAIHPTPLHEIMENILEVHLQTKSSSELFRYHPTLQAAWQQLISKHPKDANAGVVRHKMGLIFMLSGSEHAGAALSMLHEARSLIGTAEDVCVEQLLAIIDAQIGSLVRSMKDAPQK
eukprot:GEMP01049401.1.p1 GENE.GEMP01049401.1~~GEMP01049401.1.p1  ORF type:complete len:419 (+),score=101.97 GEMP01049401.1:69-1325(+)